MEVGLRVVRGPDWKWASQDGGEGHVGTVVEIGKPGSSTSPDKTVVVQWDSGSRTNYRVGYQAAYDLRIFDNAPTGVRHPNIICDVCKTHGIKGMRWKCTKCFDYDLCTFCYMSDKHDPTHIFRRFETANAIGVDMTPRQNVTKVQVRGIFYGAKVLRGPDWDWGNQDGGEGKIGKVIDIRGWDNESSRSVANVTWSSGATNVYRLGHKGKVDLKYHQDASGGNYYREHLPILGEIVEQTVAAQSTVFSQQRPVFSFGDKVKCILDTEILKVMQEGHGGWNPRMTEYIGKVGTVHRVTEKGDIRVQYEGCNNRWTFHPGALIKVETFSVGEIVRVSDDIAKVKDLQKGHGEWIDTMKDALGKTGKVTKIYSDGDLRVSVAGHVWTFNPACVSLVPGSATEMNNTMMANTREEHTNPFTSLLQKLLEHHLESTSIDKLVSEAAQDHVDVVRELLQKFPDKVDHKSSGKTALQVACHQGHMEVVKLLLENSSSLDIQDDDGDTALHYSAFGNQPVVMELLLQKGAPIDAVNIGRCSALHVAVNKQHVDCVRILLQYNCNVNIEDSYGDTALHDAIGKENQEIVEMLINHPGFDFTLKNKRGFNVLHHAALKGNNFATERLLARTRQIVDVKKDDGFAALHLAALNGHTKVAETLIVQGHCEPDILNNRKQTPLLLGVSQGHAALVEALVTKGANINAEDDDGETALHLALTQQFSEPFVGETGIEAILLEMNERGIERNLGISMACFLAQNGANMCKKNRRDKAPFDLITDPLVIDLLNYYISKGRTEAKSAIQEPMETDSSVDQECIICYEAAACVMFDPCGHRVTCEDCCMRMKKCITCQAVILRKTAPDGRILSTKVRQASVERLQYLETKIQEMEEATTCSICMERPRNVAFLCGHAACATCAQTLKTCHMCRKPITKKINLY